MKPKPFSPLNHLTVPVAIKTSPNRYFCACAHAAPRDALAGRIVGHAAGTRLGTPPRQRTPSPVATHPARSVRPWSASGQAALTLLIGTALCHLLVVRRGVGILRSVVGFFALLVGGRTAGNGRTVRLRCLFAP